ncbi:biotin carboxylase N-terminal domain-containing protein [Streptomyces shenzhenensis]|uniref:biotin carboxylase N-terminal domain-containing protein n=1 Tax=Streptomyces shenzhenensis TaxID=943815 RepID=UPI00340C1523
MTTVLIANRGEIAVRVVRAARSLRLRTIAAFTPDDRTALHVRLADEAHPLDDEQGYLDAEQLVDLARRTGAALVHPGHGFLSESADFADRDAKAGPTFVSPAPDVLRLLGDKGPGPRADRLCPAHRHTAVTGPDALPHARTGHGAGTADPADGRRSLRGDELGVPHLNPARPLAFTSGPSVTSAIELHRVEGVYEPRALDVVVIGNPEANAGESPCTPASAPDRIAEYEQAHREVPGEIKAAIRAAGATEWTIFWHSGNELSHVLEVEDYPQLIVERGKLPVNAVGVPVDVYDQDWITGPALEATSFDRTRVPSTKRLCAVVNKANAA